MGCHQLSDEASPSSDLSLTSTSHASHVTTGNGETIYKTLILPALEAATSEVLIVTCFWASSSTLSALSQSLIHLSNSILARGSSKSKLRVRIGFSSRSLLQKLFHTSCLKGHTYPPSTWSSTLGLPPPEKLQGLDLQVKSIFFLPFSVLHPKFIIVDRRHAILPSCNISWECWLECCIQVSGPVVGSLLKFWQEHWEMEDFPAALELRPSSSFSPIWDQTGCQTTLLPSPHHRHPRFRPWPLAPPMPPPTPLNSSLLQLFANADSEIYLVTPNLTSPPVLSALLAALTRGVNVQIVTNRLMMVLEQLFTAGTITEICMHHLVQRYKSVIKTSSSSRAEEGRALGSLSIFYFTPILQQGPEVKCHIKCTIIDDRVVVLGSGNMDRASWYTSQELGIAIEHTNLVIQIKSGLDAILKNRIDKWYPST